MCLWAVLVTRLCGYLVFLKIPRNQNALFHMYWIESFWCWEFYFHLYFGWNYLSDLTQISEELQLLRNWIFGCINSFLWEKTLPKYATFQYFFRISYKWVEGIGGLGCSWEKGIPCQRIKRDCLMSHTSPYIRSHTKLDFSTGLWNTRYCPVTVPEYPNQQTKVWCIKDIEWI